ncbi:hypothetical protein BLNAU_4620 [Blattamonas nauphoetae]|uniref:Uncharacterized protein n=1 Tax=Blattamonas nauphoetae TaxID=2049346 RepID=A0ABQ9Y9G3_9EUKA|nr:hypothetical protein BLNAU_4620 [Blattamonas nauphoetae]
MSKVFFSLFYSFSDFEKASDPLHTSNSMFIFARYYARQDRKAPFFPPTAYFTPNFFEDDEEGFYSLFFINRHLVSETEEAKPKPPVRPTNAPPAASRLAQSSTADDDEDEKPASKFKTDLTAVPDSIPPDSSEDFKMAKSAQNRIEENAPRSAKDKDSSSGINRSDSELNMQKNLTASPQDSSNEDAIFALLKAADTSNLTPEEKEDLDEQVKKAKEDLWVLEMEIRDYDESERLIDRNLRRAETIRRKKQKEAVEAKDKFAKGEISEPEWKELEPYLETESQQKQREEKEAHEMEQRALTREAVLSDHRVRRKECIDRIVKSMVKVGLNPYYTLPRKALVPFSPLTHSPQLLKQIRDEQREATKMSLTRSTSSLALLNPKVQKPSDRPVTEIWSRQTINTLDEFADKNAPSFSSLSQFAFAGYYQRSHDRCPPIATTVYLTPNFSTSDEPTEDPKASASLDKSTSQSTDQPKSQSGIASPFRTDLTAAPDQIPPDENGPSKIVEAAIAKAGSNEAADETPHDGGITERVLPPNFKPSPAEPENEEKKVEDELISDAQRQAEAAQLSDEEKEELEKAIRAAREDLWVLEMEIRDYDEEERIVTRKIEKEKRRRERKEKEAAEAKELFQQGKITQAELDEKVKGLETPEEKAAREEQERERDEKRTAAQELVFEDHRIRRKACLDRIISSMRKAGLNPHHTLPRKALVDNSPLTTAPSILHKLREERMEQNKMSLTRSTSSLAMLNPKLQKKIEKPITKVFSKKITSDIVEFEDLMGSNYSSNSQFVFSTYYSNHHARSTKIPTLLWYSPECYAPPKSDSTAEENTTTPAEGKKDDSINSSIPSSSQSNPPAISTGSSSSDIPITGQQPSQPFRTDLTAAPEEIPPDA